MPQYRVYWVEASGGLRPAQSFTSPEDAEAIAEFQALAQQKRAAELWEGGRLVLRLPQSR